MPALDSNLIAELLKHFRGYDENGNGYIEPGECDTLINDYFPGLDEASFAQLRETLLSDADINKDGKVDINELVAFLLQQQPAVQQGGAEGAEGPAEYSDVEHRELVNSIMRNLGADEVDMLRDAFIHMDMDSDGFVSMNEMFYVARSVLGESKFAPMAEYLEPMFIVADKDKDGKLSLTEFLASYADGPGVVPADVINACVSSIRVRLTDEEIYALQERFRLIDRNHDGYIDRDELIVALKEVLLAKFPDLTDHTFKEIVNVVMTSADADRDGKLSLSEFIRSFQEDQGVLPTAFIDVRTQHFARQLTRDEVAVLKEAFAALDRNQDGFVDYMDMYQTLWDSLQNAVEDKSRVTELCDLIVAVADRNKDGKLVLTDFIRSFAQYPDIMAVPVAAAQDRIAAARNRLNELIESGQLDKIVHAFAHLDLKQDGFLDHEELSGILSTLIKQEVPDASDEVVHEIIDVIIATADTNQDGKLSLVEFVRSFVEGDGVVPEGVVNAVDAHCNQAQDGAAHQEQQQQKQQPQQGEQRADVRPLTAEEINGVLQVFSRLGQDERLSLGDLPRVMADALAGVTSDPEAQQYVADVVAQGVPQLKDGRVVVKEIVAFIQRGDASVPVSVDSEDKKQLVPQKQAATPSSKEHTPDRQLQQYRDDDDRSPIVNDVSGCPITDGQLRKQFKFYDRDNNGYLDRQEFKKVYMAMENYGLEPTQQEVDRIFNKYCREADKVQYEEFCVLMLQRSRM